MKRINIDFGIDLGTTNSAIACMDNGSLRLFKSKDDQRDTTPSAVSFKQNGAMSIGNAAFSSFREECTKRMRREVASNAFIEFKRTMGTNKSYIPTVKNSVEEYSSEQLSSDVLKYLKGYVDEGVKTAVITIPAAYTLNQIDAVRRAGDLAGFKYIETLQEPVAAAMAFGVENKGEDGFWLVFDFGGGTFDTALVKVEDGIVKIIDSSGDNHLGGKDLDYEIVDKLIIPHIQENYNIENLLSNNDTRASLRTGLKFEAETLKNILSFQKEHEIYIEEGEVRVDDDGEDIEIDLTVTQEELIPVIAPIFQKAINICAELLQRNNLTGQQIASLILVGGPTLSPILRNMLAQQICEPDTSVDPMTVVARGAAIYASTVSLPENVIDENRDSSKIQLGIDYESSSVEESEFVTIKVLEEKTEGQIPEAIFAQLSRDCGGWSSEKIEIDSIGDVCDVDLVMGKTNTFTINLFDHTGNRIECEPTAFGIIQGSVLGGQTQPLHFGIETLDPESKQLLYRPVKGLEKNATLPATGAYKGSLKTQKGIRPGISSDFIRIPLYQGEFYAEGTRAINNEHVYDVVISGNDIPKLLPAGSDVELLIEISRSQEVSVEAFFPYLDFTFEVSVPTGSVQTISTEWLSSEFEKAESSLEELDSEPDIKNRLEEAKNVFESNSDDVDTKSKARHELREVLKEVDRLEAEEKWPSMERKLKSEFKRLEDANNDLGNDETSKLVDSMRHDLENTLKAQDLQAGQHLLDSIGALFFELTKLYQFMGCIRDYNNHFDSMHWTDRTEARNLVNQGLSLIDQRASADEIGSVVFKLFDLLPEQERSSIDDSVLVG